MYEDKKIQIYKTTIFKLQIMKKIIMSLAVALMLATTVQAQSEDCNDQKFSKKMDKTECIQNRTNDMVKTYNLNSEQAKELLELNTTYDGKMGMGMPGGKGPGRGHGPAMKDKDNNSGRPELTDAQKAEFKKKMEQDEASRKEYESKLQEIMTSDQYKSYQADQQKRMEKGPHNK